MTTNVRKLSTNREAREHLKAQLADYLAQAPESTRSAHTWMKRVDAVGLVIVMAAFVVALYGSFTWANTNPAMIAIAWFFFATCCSLMAILLGIHAILIRAFPPLILPGKAQKFLNGSSAVWTGVASILGGSFMAVLWVTFAYSTATFNLAMIIPLVNVLGVFVGIGILVSIVFAIYQKAFQSK